MIKRARILISLLIIGATILLAVPSFAQPAPAGPANPPGITIDVDSFREPIQFSSTVGLLLAVTFIGMLPFFLISTTTFIRFAIVLGMLRGAIGTNTTPPNQVLISLALFMSIYVMTPTYQAIYTDAFKPYNEGQITQQEALDSAFTGIRNFMLKFTREKDLALFIEFSKIPEVQNIDEVPMMVIVPSFLISELKTAFQIGFLLYIPFLVIDLVVSNILLSLGMFMLSPVMISLPFKILLFVLTDGWNLIIRGLLTGVQ